MYEVNYLYWKILNMFKEVGIWNNILVEAKCKTYRKKFYLGSSRVEE